MELKLTPYELQKVTQVLRQTNDLEAFRRALILRNLHFGGQIGDVAQEMAISRASIYYLLRQFQDLGDLSQFLMRQPGSGRPSLWTASLRKKLQSTLEKDPEDFGYFARGWTIGLLKDHLEQACQVRFSDESIRRELHKLKYVNKRPRHCLDPDPGRYKKKRNSQVVPQHPLEKGHPV